MQAKLEVLAKSLIETICTDNKAKFEILLKTIKKHPNKKNILNYGVNKVHYEDEEGFTPLVFALIYTTGEAILSALLQAGADPNYAIQKGAYKGCLPLALAVTGKKLEFTKLLLQHGADPKAISNWRTNDSKQPLFRASIFMQAININVPSILIALTEKINVLTPIDIEGDYANMCPLVLAIKNAIFIPNTGVTILKYLIEKYSVDLNTIFMSAPNEEISYLQLIIDRFSPAAPEAVIAILKVGKIDLSSDPRPLYWASESGKMALMGYFATQLKDINMPIPTGLKKDYTALLGACLDDNLVNAKWLFSRGARPNLFTLEVAIQHCKVEIVEWLLDDAGMDPDAYRENLYSPLMVAVLTQKYKIIELLLERSKYPPNSKDPIPESIQKMRASALNVAISVKDRISFNMLLAVIPNLAIDVNLIQIVKVGSEQDINAFNYAEVSITEFGEKQYKYYFDIYTQPLREVIFCQDVWFLSACIQHDPAAAQAIIRKGYFQGLSILQCALMSRNELVLPELLKILKVEVSELNKLLFSALCAKEWEWANTLITHGANVNCSVFVNNTQLVQLACFCMLTNNKDAFVYLLKHNLDLTQPLIIGGEIYPYSLAEIVFLKGGFRKLVNSFDPNLFSKLGIEKTRVEIGEPLLPEKKSSAPSFFVSAEDTLVNIQLEERYSNLELVRYLELPKLLRFALYEIQKIRLLLTEPMADSKKYYLLLMSLLRFSEAMYVHIKEIGRNEIISLQDAFQIRNIAAHLYHQLDYSHLYGFAEIVCKKLYSKLADIGLNKKNSQTVKVSFDDSELYMALIKQLPVADQLLTEEILVEKILCDVQQVYEISANMSYLKCKLSTEDYVNELVMRFAVIGQYMRLLTKLDDNSFKEVLTKIFQANNKEYLVPQVERWLLFTIKIRAIVAHEFTENSSQEQQGFLSTCISRDTLFKVIKDLKSFGLYIWVPDKLEIEKQINKLSELDEKTIAPDL